MQQAAQRVCGVGPTGRPSRTTYVILGVAALAGVALIVGLGAGLGLRGSQSAGSQAQAVVAPSQSATPQVVAPSSDPSLSPGAPPPSVTGTASIQASNTPTPSVAASESVSASIPPTPSVTMSVTATRVLQPVMDAIGITVKRYSGVSRTQFTAITFETGPTSTCLQKLDVLVGTINQFSGTLVVKLMEAASDNTPTTNELYSTSKSLTLRYPPFEIVTSFDLSGWTVQPGQKYSFVFSTTGGECSLAAAESGEPTVINGYTNLAQRYSPGGNTWVPFDFVTTIGFRLWACY